MIHRRYITNLYKYFIYEIKEEETDHNIHRIGFWFTQKTSIGRKSISKVKRNGPSLIGI